MINIGVIGLGFGKEVHVPAFRKDKRCRVIAISGQSEQKALLAAKDLELEYGYGNYLSLLHNPNIQAVSIAVPPAIQCSIIKQALIFGKHVFCEKPLGGGSDEGISLAKMAKDKGLVTAIDFEFPELSEWQEAKRIIHSGKLGSVRHIKIDWHLQTYTNRIKLQSWKSRVSDNGGTLYNFVSHVFFNVEWLLGPISELCCNISPLGNDLVQVIMIFSGSQTGEISVSTNSPFTQMHRIEVFFESGRLVLQNSSPSYLSDFSLKIISSDGCQVLYNTNKEEESYQDSRINAVAKLVRSFVDEIEIPIGRRSFPGLLDGARNEILLEAAVASNKTRQWIKLNP